MIVGKGWMSHGKGIHSLPVPAKSMQELELSIANWVSQHELGEQFASLRDLVRDASPAPADSVDLVDSEEPAQPERDTA